MLYIKKAIDLHNTGHQTECWMVDFKTVTLSDLPIISVQINGYKDFDAFVNKKRVVSSVLISTSAIELELQGSIGYSDIPKLYDVLINRDPENHSPDVPAYQYNLIFAGGEIVDGVVPEPTPEPEETPDEPTDEEVDDLVE